MSFKYKEENLIVFVSMLNEKKNVLALITIKDKLGTKIME